MSGLHYGSESDATLDWTPTRQPALQERALLRCRRRRGHTHSQRQDAQTLVLRSEGRIIAMAMVSHFNDGIYSYGILHVLEVDEPRANYALQVGGALVRACRDWLKGHGTDELLVAPTALRLVHQGRPRIRRCPPDRNERAFGQHIPGPIRVPRQVWA